MPRKKVEVTEVLQDPVKVENTQAGTASPASFYDIDFKTLDRDLSPEQQKEWTAIYASFRSKTPLRGTVIGVDEYPLTMTNPETKEKVVKRINCLVVMEFRAKVIIPETEIWFNPDAQVPDYLIHQMVGAKVDYVITNVDREGECAIASRRAAMGYYRNRFFRDSRNKAGKMLHCNLLVVGPKRTIAECCGFDLSLSNRDLSYTAILDLRNEYYPGQELLCKLLASDKEAEKIEVSVKEVNPNPFVGADQRHPMRSRRQAIISGSYAGGLFCRLSDDTTILCLYSPGQSDEEFYLGDKVLMMITRFDYEKKQIFGKIVTKL